MYICRKCGTASFCTVAAAVHALTTHEYEDLCISPDMADKETGARCVDCLLIRTVPIEDIWREKGLIK